MNNNIANPLTPKAGSSFLIRLVGLVIFTLSLLLSHLPAAASQTIETDYSEVALHSEMETVSPGQSFWLVLEFKLKDDWHIYWENPGDSGLPVQLNWNMPEGFSAEAMHWPGPDMFEMDGLMNYGYSGEPKILIPMMAMKNLETDKEYLLEAKASWLICKDICIPESGTVSVSVSSAGAPKASEHAMMVQEALADLPTIIESPASYEIDGETMTLKVDIPAMDAGSFEEAYFFSREGGVVNHAAQQAWEVDESTLTGQLVAGGTAPSAQWSGLLEVEQDDSSQFYDIILHKGKNNIGDKERNPLPALAESQNITEAAPASYDEEDVPITFTYALLMAFLGGLLLNAMPCVFPVLALKALSLSQKADKEPTAIRFQGLAYCAGVVASFLFLALVIILLKESGKELGWGFQLQSPTFVAVLVYMFIMLGLALAGMFELPMLFGGLAAHREEKSSLKGSFLTGILAVIVATPCTVPFMAPAIGFAFVQPVSVTLAIMVALGVGLAFPYLAISFYPALWRFFPRPGMWMELFKQFMAFPMFATAAWLLWVLVQQGGADGLFIVLAASLSFVLLLWLGQVTQQGFLRLIYWLLAIFIFFYSLSDIATLKPPHTQTHQLSATLQAEPYSQERLASLREEGKAVFVNATAAWCITCKVNERLALRSEALAAHLQEENITYMVADWTNYDDNITKFLHRYEREGVPLYVYFPREGKPVVLPQLLTESLLLEKLGAR
jgi:thiol:disulfide interchange protein DsbD